MTREERKQQREERKDAIKARRLAKREARRTRKALQKAKWEELKVAVAGVPDMDQLEGTIYEERFKDIWPAVKAALEFAISLKITRERLDNTLAKIVLIGDGMADGQEVTDEDSLEFLERLDKVWDWIRTVLSVAKVFTPDNVDDVIDKIIEIGDWILDDDDD